MTVFSSSPVGNSNSEAIRLKPDFADAYYNRGGEHFKKGKYDLAIADFTEVIRLESGFAMAKAFLAEARALKGKK